MEQTTFKMMSKADEDLLDDARPTLMNKIDLEGSDLLAQLCKRNALRKMQEEHIKVL